MTTTNAKVRISIRVRPFLSTEVGDGAVEVTAPSGQDDGSVSVSNPRDPNQRYRFNFQSCWGGSATQEALFDKDVRPLLEQVFNGYTACIFCYGVTSSGKTHTMQGSVSQAGIIPRVVRALLDGPHDGETANGQARKTQKAKKTSEVRVEVYVSYMEIYKDDVYDLLVARADAPKLPIREADGKIFVANLTEVPVSTRDEFDHVFSVACKSRSTGSTLLNRASSRSHAILGLRVRTSHSEDNSVIEGKIHLIDLAGSENNKLTGNDPSRMAESSAINRSLSVLGQVVDALNRGLPRIPYRDSKLTRILQDALGGSSLSLLICNIAPGNKFRQDTLNTLNFATRTKEIENKVVPSSKNDSRAPTRLSRDAVSSLHPPRAQMAPALPRSSTSRHARISNESAASHSSKGISIISEDEMKEQIAKVVAEEVRRQMEARVTPVMEKIPSPADVVRDVEIATEKAMLAEDLRKRVELLEKRSNVIEADDNDALIMSPDGKKKLAQALVAMARACQEKGQLEKALDHYKHAQRFAKKNSKLQVRIDEVQAALEEGKTLTQFKKDRADCASGSVVNDAEHGGRATRSRSRKHRMDGTAPNENEGPCSSNRDEEDRHRMVEDRHRMVKRRKSNDGTAQSASPLSTFPPQLPIAGTGEEDLDSDVIKAHAKHLRRSRAVALSERANDVFSVASAADTGVEIVYFGKKPGAV